MIRTANLPETDRRVLFSKTAAQRKLHPAIVEKDFWVCYLLDHLFHRNPYREAFVFKGGTSLSKAYHVIHRFSEDIDLILDWRILHYDDPTAWAVRSNTQQDRFNKQMNRDAAAFIGTTLLDSLKEGLEGELFVPWALMTDDDPQVIRFRYPRAFEQEYLLAEVRLEIGPIAEWTPSHPARIRSFAAETYGHVFERPDTEILTVDAERTFWEKTTILHRVAHMPEDKPLPLRYARHYYDLYCMSESEVKANAFRHAALLERDVAFKQKFYYSKNASYETATLSSIRLTPPERLLSALSEDYGHMRNMLYGEIPSFDRIMKGIAELEAEIHALSPSDRK